MAQQLLVVTTSISVTLRLTAAAEEYELIGDSDKCHSLPPLLLLSPHSHKHGISRQFGASAVFRVQSKAFNFTVPDFLDTSAIPCSCWFSSLFTPYRAEMSSRSMRVPRWGGNSEAFFSFFSFQASCSFSLLDNRNSGQQCRNRMSSAGIVAASSSDLESLL